VQYLLAADRDNPWVAGLYDPQHPAVMRALDLVAKAARRHGRPASVCGDLAGDPAMAVILLGMGFHGVSVAPNFLAEIKFAVRSVSLLEAEAFAAEVLSERTSEGVGAVLGRLRARLYDDTIGAGKGASS